MATTTKTQDLIEREKQFWTAMKEKDARATERMTDDRCIVVGPQGVSAIDPATMAKLTKEGQWELQRFELDDQKAQVQFLNDDVALVAYNVKERVAVDGATLSIDANDASVWVRRDGEWVCAMHTESLAGDPYGRDRRV
jgi:hypothetical protein